MSNYWKFCLLANLGVRIAGLPDHAVSSSQCRMGLYIVTEPCLSCYSRATSEARKLTLKTLHPDLATQWWWPRSCHKAQIWCAQTPKNDRKGLKRVTGLATRVQWTQHDSTPSYSVCRGLHRPQHPHGAGDVSVGIPQPKLSQHKGSHLPGQLLPGQVWPYCKLCSCLKAMTSSSNVSACCALPRGELETTNWQCFSSLLRPLISMPVTYLYKSLCCRQQ